MKTKEELNALKEEAETLNKKLRALSEEELAQVTGGLIPLLALICQSKEGSVFGGTFDGNAKDVNLKGNWGIGPEGYDCSGLIF